MTAEERGGAAEEQQILAWIPEGKERRKAGHLTLFIFWFKLENALSQTELTSTPLHSQYSSQGNTT